MTTENSIYTELANLVHNKIRNNQSYFSGSVSCDDYGFMCCIVIYYNDDNKVTDIVPVWYDFHNKRLGENFEFDFDKFVESYKNL